MIQMSTSRELEELRTRKTELEEESSSLREEQKNLVERVNILEEKIAVEGLKNNNKTTREAIAQLESKMSDLEQKLKETSQVFENSEPAKEMMPGIPEVHEPPEEETTEITEEVPEEPQEDAVTVRALEDTVSQQGYSEDSKKQSEKKRRRIF